MCESECVCVCVCKRERECVGMCLDFFFLQFCIILKNIFN